MPIEHAPDACWEVWKVLNSENPKGEGKLGNEKGGLFKNIKRGMKH